MRALPWLIAATLAVLSATPAPAATVTDWIAVINRADDAANGPASAPTQANLRAATRATLAMFEAANSTDPHYRSYLHIPPAPGADQQAAIATAVQTVLTNSVPAQAKEAATIAAKTLAAIPDSPTKTAGIAAGRAAASASLAAGGLDPDRPITPYRPAAIPGVWVPTTPPFFPPIYIALKPWFLLHADSARPPPPPARTSATYLAAFAETARLGGKTSAARSAAQTESAQFWKRIDEPSLLDQVAARPGHSAVDAAHFYALAAMASDDALEATAETKLHYALWRPVTAIRNADLDPATRTARVADWEPLLPTPAHPCGHCVEAATLAAIIGADPTVAKTDRFRFTSLTDGGKTRLLTLDESVAECSMSRIYAGVHWRFSTQAGEALGHAVAAKAIAALGRQ